MCAPEAGLTPLSTWAFILAAGLRTDPNVGATSAGQRIHLDRFVLDGPGPPDTLALCVPTRAVPVGVKVDGELWTPTRWTVGKDMAGHRCWQAVRAEPLTPGAHTVEILVSGTHTLAWTGMVTRFMDASTVLEVGDDSRGNAPDLFEGDRAYNSHDYDQAIAHYQNAMGRMRRGALRDQIAHKVAVSCWLNAEDPQSLQAARERLAALLRHLERRGEGSAVLATDVRRSLVLSFLRQSEAEPGGPSPLDLALRFLEAQGARPDAFEVFAALANLLVDFARYEDAIILSAYIQQRWPEDPGNPDLQWKVAVLEMWRSPADPEAPQQALLDLVDRYGQPGAWAQANRKNAEALAIAAGKVRLALGHVAYQSYLNAETTGDPGDYREAAELYLRYLEQFPTAEDYEEMLSYLGTTLVKAQRTLEAEQVFEKLSRREASPYAEGALWQLMQTRRAMLIAQYGKAEALPKDAAEEKRTVLPSGKQRVVYKVDAEHQRFIAVCDALVAAQFKDKDYGAALDQYRAALAYLPAYLLYNHGHLDEARSRFEKIIATWPEADEAAYAACLIVDSYSDEENVDMMKMFASKYSACAIGPLRNRD